MFSFGKKRNFVEFDSLLRRICDLTTPNLSNAPNLARAENRYNRTITARGARHGG